MKIAQIAPLVERCPPRFYGGTERVVSYLTEELVRQGEDVTLFASGDSVTSAKLVACAPRALRLERVVDALPYHMIMLDEVRRRAHEFDVLHFHIDVLPAPLIRPFLNRTLTTLHGRLDLQDLKPFYEHFSDMPLVSISDAQRAPMPPVKWFATVHHGLPRDMLPFSPRPEGYLAFIGRISPEKRPDRAIEIAARLGMPLRIAAKVDRADEAYWRDVIEPMIKAHSNVEYIGEIGEAEKPEFLGGAGALLFPIDWPEPFGLVMIEAMACGTPVVAFRRGSTPEVIDDGVTGVLVETMEGAIAAVPKALALARATVRARFEERFSVERMARDYVKLYHEIAGRKTPGPAPSEPPARLKQAA